MYESNGDKCHLIVCIYNKDNPYAFIGNPAKDKYLRDFYRQTEDRAVNVIGYYCCDEFVKIICMDTDEEVLLKEIRITNKQYGGYYRRVMQSSFVASTQIEYIDSEDDLRREYCRVMCGRTGEAFYADYMWSSICMLGGKRVADHLYNMIDWQRLAGLFGKMFALRIIAETIILKSAEAIEDKKDLVVKKMIWKIGRYIRVEDFIKKAKIEEKRQLVQALFLVHGFSYADICNAIGCSKSTVYRYLT